eukprot:TRINITY_DN7022_c0_g1_i4.p1 TRINITY_DN7022_c0_g1~~TRINITY_DN7022_c0_g1_i4.p1  ORF type:complete len:431 (+),score=109.33 TRINITY_DN7022_c0_g1_i4:23-1294(+)
MSLLKLTAFCALLACALAAEAPNGVHLMAMQNLQQAVRVMWSLPTTSLDDAPASTCNWGLRSSSLTNSAPAKAYTYSAGGFKGTLYDCVMNTSAYPPSTRVYYTVGSADTRPVTLHYTTAPTIGSDVKVIHWADMGIQNPVATSSHVQAGAASDIQNNNYTLIINAGDTSYADDYNLDVPEVPNAWVLDRYWEEVQGSAGYAPMALAPGNHEDQYHFAAHLNRTRMPAPINSTGPLERFYYSFDYGCVHFISFSTEHDVSKGSEQWQFVLADLKRAQANRDQVPWIVVFTHHPFYCTSILDPERCTTQMDHFLDAYEDMFHEYKVDVFTSGHNHCYERTYPVYKRQPIKTYHQPNATVYVVNGAAGDIEGTQNDWKRDIDWRAFHNEERYTGYSRMEANKQALSWTYYDAKHGQVVDTWTLTK